MRVSVVFTILAFSGITFAKSCNKGFKYCGSSLIQKGDYKDQLLQVLYDRNDLNSNYNDVLFSCIGTPWGLVDWVQRCPGSCIDGGSGKNDFCTPS
ncbi:hypothetical protein BDQ12DRAFT_693353 [Crucibulum laeve]|uniref:Uncharacterized protein n=1 Tax=Crucibulum laeve TaxID=68775 RepID=A0A5C3LGT3_9AGAR|nr:hypothetical protein BDQ12DRAFT_693353 [Crucibulum laeve]